MDTIAFVFAIGILSFILLQIASLLNTEHKGFQFVLIAFVFFNLLLIPKVIIDDQYSCENVISNSTVIANTTTYEYSEICSDNPNKTADWFFKLDMLLFSLFLLYCFLYIFYKVGGTNWLKMKGL